MISMIASIVIIGAFFAFVLALIGSAPKLVGRLIQLSFTKKVDLAKQVKSFLINSLLPRIISIYLVYVATRIGIIVMSQRGISFRNLDDISNILGVAAILICIVEFAIEASGSSEMMIFAEKLPMFYGTTVGFMIGIKVLSHTPNGLI